MNEQLHTFVQPIYIVYKLQKTGKPYKGLPVVGVSGFEPEASWTRTAAQCVVPVCGNSREPPQHRGEKPYFPPKNLYF